MDVFKSVIVLLTAILDHLRKALPAAAAIRRIPSILPGRPFVFNGTLESSGKSIGMFSYRARIPLAFTGRVVRFSVSITNMGTATEWLAFTTRDEGPIETNTQANRERGYPIFPGTTFTFEFNGTGALPDAQQEKELDAYLYSEAPPESPASAGPAYCGFATEWRAF